MIDFEYISFKLRLSTTSETPLGEPPVIIQYYHFENQAWTSLYEETINKSGSLDVRKISPSSSLTAPAEEIYFFDMIKAGYIPHLRVIPGVGADIPEGFDKQLVGSSTYSFGLNTDAAAYEFDFGSLWIGTKDMITVAATIFPDFIPTTSFFKPSGIVTESENTPVPINELYTNIVSEIEAASASSGRSAFKLSNMSLKLKALIQRDGDSVTASLLDLENSENVNGDAISELVFDITPVNQQGINEVIMPDLTGLTETAVRKVLKSMNQRLNPVYQKNMSVVNGDSFKQSPAEGQKIQPNQVITIIFSKHE